jgi:5-formyltetrahydrofolate cyclo-ligase
MTDTLPYKDKKMLRDHARAIRSSLSPEEIEEKSGLICDRLLELLDGTDPLMVYASKPREVNTRLLIRNLLSLGKTLVVPIIEKETNTLRLSYLKDPEVLQESTFQVPEPVGHELPALASEVKVVLIPMLAFDKKGNRLGYGAGYYDRFLARNPKIIRIGLAFACQEASAIPCEENDIKMDLIVSENGIYSCSGRSYKNCKKSPDITHHTLK